MPDNLSPKQRSYTMSRMRSKDTVPELTIQTLVRARHLRWRKHLVSLPGKPDLVFVRAKVAVFIDGDFFHGWRLSVWKSKLSDYWQQKLERNRRRDIRTFRSLRKAGWLVIRLWQHQVKRDPIACVDRIEGAVRSRLQDRSS